jgi:hypothetical protein
MGFREGVNNTLLPGIFQVHDALCALGIEPSSTPCRHFSEMVQGAQVLFCEQGQRLEIGIDNTLNHTLGTLPDCPSFLLGYKTAAYFDEPVLRSPNFPPGCLIPLLATWTNVSHWENHCWPCADCLVTSHQPTDQATRKISPEVPASIHFCGLAVLGNFPFAPLTRPPRVAKHAVRPYP